MGVRVVAESSLTPTPVPEDGATRGGTTGGQVPAARTTADGYLDRIVKYIPSQVITFYTAAIVWMAAPDASAPGQPAAAGAATVPPTSEAAGTELWAAFALGLGLTVFLTYWQTREAGKPPATLQIGISTLAFFVWAYATGGPFTHTGYWKPGWAATALGVFVIVIGTIAPKETPAPNAAADVANV